MKKFFAYILTALFLVVSAGCTSVPTTQPKSDTPTKQEQSANQQNTTSPAANAQTVGKRISIGDTAADWERVLGHPYAQGDTIKNYQEGQFKVVFEKDRAVTITIAAKDGKNPLTDDLVPQDGQKQSESSKDVGGMTMTVEKWHSNALQAAIPETKGNYTIMKHTKGQAYDSVVIDCTPNLKK
ncbi:hypothetical protein [uncultured Megasphaera sp.]|uniref:hypothetical protein n=1 Tax=uncultured Megasphaera sp. TaxID=165188 RepID=UPI00265A368B|nr:hypothetical protein [uncultured Megasphaera sp.]